MEDFRTYFGSFMEKAFRAGTNKYGAYNRASAFAVGAWCSIKDMVFESHSAIGYLDVSRKSDLIKNIESCGFRRVYGESTAKLFDKDDNYQNPEDDYYMGEIEDSSNSEYECFCNFCDGGPVVAYITMESGHAGMENLIYCGIDISAEKEAASSFLEKIKSWDILSKNPDLGIPYIYMLGASPHGGMTFNRIKGNAVPLLEQNYEKNVVSEYNKISEQFLNDNPFGRIVIITGEPGTGKTYFVRGLVDKLYKDVSFIYIPSRMAASIDSPELVSLLISHRKENKKPIVFIMEDADQCIEKRDGFNMSIMSSLLNYTDGIMGSILDIRVIATTNLKNINLDEAIMRPGRLLSKFEIGRLSSDAVARFFNANERKDLADKARANELHDSPKITLAEAYATLTGKKFEKVAAEAKVGFLK